MLFSFALRVVGFLSLLAVLIAPKAVLAMDPSDLCLRAAASASEASGVPYDVLLAIAVVETARDEKPWPWTVNLGGEGHWLHSAKEAEAIVAQALEDGLTNVDLGCFQLNYRWHAEAFVSIADMLDPERNAAYAAGFLAQHYARTGDWAAAAAAYHSTTPDYAARYRARFETAWAGADSIDRPAPVDASRTNGFPLLVAGKTGSRGSLVPATTAGLRLIGSP